MPLLTSRFGFLLTLIYLAGAGWVVQDELRHTGGGWINLRGMGTTIVTAPSQATIGYLLQAFGVKRINFNEPGISGYAQLALHLLVTAAVVYLIGYGIEWGARRILVGTRG
jgi:hypothetical protein